MADTGQLIRHLIGSALLTEGQRLQAEDYAMTTGIGLDEAIVFLNLLDYEALGKGLKEIHGLPYRPLLPDPPPDATKQRLSLKFAERWSIFPVDYSSENNVLTLATASPGEPQMDRDLRTVFPLPMKLCFTVASEAEIHRAIEVHYKGKPYSPSRELELPEEFTITEKADPIEAELPLVEPAQPDKKILIIEPDHSLVGAMKTMLRAAGYKSVQAVASLDEAIQTFEKTSPNMVLVNGKAAKAQGALVDKLSTSGSAAFLSYESLVPLLLGQEYPYHQMSEALMSLVTFLVGKSLSKDPEKLYDTRMRSRYCKLLALRLGLPPGRVDAFSSRILMVDPEEFGDSSLVVRLSNEGYEVKAVLNVREAAKIIVNSDTDLIISEVDLPGTDGLRFCRALKEKKDTAHIPFIFFTHKEGERIAAECIDAGADEFLRKPADTELLCVKIRRILSARRSSEKKPGVHGTLTEMGFTDIIQSLTSGDKDVQIILDATGRKGQVFVQGGEVIHAAAGDTEGEAAFYEIMAWQDADFQIIPCTAFPARTIHVPAMSLLMEGARLTDELGDPGDDA